MSNEFINLTILPSEDSLSITSEMEATNPGEHKPVLSLNGQDGVLSRLCQRQKRGYRLVQKTFLKYVKEIYRRTLVLLPQIGKRKRKSVHGIWLEKSSPSLGLEFPRAIAEPRDLECSLRWPCSTGSVYTTGLIQWLGGFHTVSIQVGEFLENFTEVSHN